MRWTNFPSFVLISLILIFMTPKGVEGALGADQGSLMKIVQKLCGSSHNEIFASQFYGCYDLLDSREKCIFDKCQKEAFGCTLSTKKNIEHSCTVPEKLQPYQDCLMRQFSPCGFDIIKSVTTINMCQGRLLGLE